jgi:ERCC4-type nuclease
MQTVEDVLTVPFTVVIDTREQLPFTFQDLRADAKDGRRLLRVPTACCSLATGDYSLAGLENQLAIERKSLVDLFATLGSRRERFQRELERLATYPFAAVVIEADWATIIRHPPERSRLLPKTVFRSVIAWQLRYPRVHWWTCPNRGFAEVTTFRLLERFWKQHHHLHHKEKLYA